MYQTTLNDQTFSVQFTPTGPQLNGQFYDWNMVRLTDRTYHIIRNNRSFTAELLSLDSVGKTVRLRINQTIYEISVQDRFDLLLEKMGMSSAATAKVNDLKAPMPGLIVGINVQPGDMVQKGDNLLILEAMKMENLLKAPADATVRGIRVGKGDRVEKGQVLVEFAE